MFDRFVKNQATLTTDKLEGLKLFSTEPVPALGIRGGNCVTCHSGVLTGHKSANIGLDKVLKKQIITSNNWQRRE